VTLPVWPRLSDIPGLEPPMPYAVAGELSGFPLVKLPSGHEAVHLTDFEDVRAALVDPQLSRESANEYGAPSLFPSPFPSKIIFALDPPVHGRVKGLVTRDFAERAMAERRPAVEELVDRAVQAMSRPDAGRFDLVDDHALPLIRAILADILGMAPDDVERLQAYATFFSLMDWDEPDQMFDSFVALWAFFGEFVRGTRKAPSSGLIDLLLERRTAGSLVKGDEITGLLLTIFVAVSSNLGTNIIQHLYILLARPDVWQALSDHPELMSGWVDEVARLVPLGQFPTAVRIAHNDIQLPGGRIPAGSAVLPDTATANRDPARFPNPDTFDPTRTSGRHLGFGHGPHQCLGMALSRMVLLVLLRKLSDPQPQLILDVDPASLSWQTGIAMHRPRHLPVRPR
jgi:cytochrome P450